MRIVIDMQSAQGENRSRGLGRYTLALAEAIVRNKGRHDIVLALNGLFPETVSELSHMFQDILPSTNICVWHSLAPVSYADEQNNLRRKCAELIRENFLFDLKPDIVLIPSFFEGLGSDIVSSIGASNQKFLVAVTVHDLIPLIYPDIYLHNPRVRDWYFEKLDFLRRADLLLAISDSSRQECVDHIGWSDTKIVDCSEAVSEIFERKLYSESYKNEVLGKYGIERRFIMYTGGIDHRKNIEGLIRAFALLPMILRSTHQLVIVCSVQSDSREYLNEFATREGLQTDDLILTGYVPEEHLIAFYNLCAVFVFPSFHEGFGLPVLEAMRCGAPTIASNSSSLPEVLGLTEALFDPCSDEAISTAIERVLTDEAFRNHLISHGLKQAKKFSWDETALRAITAMSTIVDESQLKSVNGIELKRRPKLAYISPLPPERSGISDYSAELLPVLAAYYEIEVVIDQAFISDPWILANCQIRTLDWFIAHAENYERKLYHFGNSAFHQHMFDLLQSIPGVVVLHDFYLSGVLNYMEALNYAPGCFTRQLYHSHGYKGILDRAQAKDVAEVIWAYPCSLDVIENSIGTIVHSPNSTRLAKQWYGADDSKFAIIPLLRAPVIDANSALARKKLGFSEQDFIVCSFGMLGPTKLNHRLLVSWLVSALATAENCYLVFVGANDSGQYGIELLKLIESNPRGAKVRITGWVDQEDFRNYLAAADLGIQLRSHSRGETSAAVLDCMNFGIATIVNANGSMADLPDDAVYKLPDEFTDQMLTQALETLWGDSGLRNEVGQRAKEIICELHDPAECAKQYQTTIEDFYKRNPPIVSTLLRDISNIEQEAFSETDLCGLAKAIAMTFPANRLKRTILVDISELVQRDARTGIQRVVRSILLEWLLNPPSGINVEPVYATEGKEGYCYARQFTQRLLGTAFDYLPDEPVEFVSGDCLVCLDLQPKIQVEQRTFYNMLRRQGVSVKFVVYDLLCVMRPEFFPPGASESFSSWLEVVCENDSPICISRTVANELSVWRNSHTLQNNKSFQIEWFHLGAEINQLCPTKGLPSDSESTLQQLNQHKSFLLVGTIEPRKGHAEVLDAFEILWRNENLVNLVIVGKQGWMVEAVVDRIRNHSELNNRLFWFDGISDEYLEKIYAACACLIAASHAEGFGLPLIEAAQHGLPIIARDIPVFREVAGEHAHYFKYDTPEGWAQDLELWLDLNKTDQHIKSDKLSWLTWSQSATQLMHHLI